MSGIITSISTTSNVVCRHARMASTPPSTISTWWPSLRRVPAATTWLILLSSAISTRDMRGNLSCGWRARVERRVRDQGVDDPTQQVRVADGLDQDRLDAGVVRGLARQVHLGGE